jgi:iron(III) transport system ATP-binding protein
MISVNHLDKTYRSRNGEVHAVKDVSFDVQRGDFVTLLGPSGCGKTTILRSVAGLETPTSGEISIGGRVVYSAERKIQMAPAQRRIGMVFQSYAIWPHMTVFDNVAYPLRRRQLPRGEIAERTNAVLEMLGLGHLGPRPATQLSGGQQQRVAVARALVSEAELILFDEPLSNLDAKLRKEVRQEIRDLQQRLGITVLYVTHDQEEAMAVSDRIVVMDGGVIKDSGSPEQIYLQPADIFSARFVGESNTFLGTVAGLDHGRWVVSTPMGDLLVDQRPLAFDLALPQPVLLTARPEHLRLGRGTEPASAKDSAFPGVVRTNAFLGPFAEVTVELPGDIDVVVRTGGASSYRPGEPVTVSVPADSIVVHPATDL